MYCDWPALRRCCFCLPLRRGVLVFGYLNILFSGLMIAVINLPVSVNRPSDLPAELCLAIYCFDVAFNVLLLYGAHKKIYKYVKIYYYFAIATTLSSLLMNILDIAASTHNSLLVFEMIMFGFVGLVLELYLILLVSSLMKKLEKEGPNVYENQLHQFINGEIKVEANGEEAKPNDSTVPKDTMCV